MAEVNRVGSAVVVEKHNTTTLREFDLREEQEPDCMSKQDTNSKESVTNSKESVNVQFGH